MKKFITICIIFLFTSAFFQLYAQPLVAGFNSNFQKGCSPLVVTFSDNSSGNISSYFWDFGNGSTSNLKNPSTIYKNAGYYHVKLIITDNVGNKDSIIQNNYIRIFNNPYANFYTASQKFCTRDSISFIDSSIQGDTAISSWIWDFGDGYVNNGQQQKYAYTTGSDYSIVLQVEDLNGCKSNIIRPQYIQVMDEPILDFKSDKSFGCSFPVAISFKDSTKNTGGQTLSYKWYFGNGDSSSQKNPVYNYSKNGVYDVTLKVSDNFNCIRTLTKTSFINIFNPTAEFVPTDTAGCIPISIKMLSTSKDTNGLTKYYWDFGTGIKDTSHNPTAYFNTAGKYTVYLIVTNNNGCSDTFSREIYAKDSTSFNFDFKATDTITCLSSLNANFSYSTTATVASVLWDFGDKSTSTTTSPSHNYTLPGNYDVSLKVTDIYGCTIKKTKPKYIKVRSIEASFIVDKNKGCKNSTIIFNDKSISDFPIVSYFWDFGNGDTSSKKNPVCTYKDTGTYYPKLLIKNSIGCIDSITYNNIKISEKPKADFTYTKGTGCYNQNNVSFISLTNKGLVKAQTYKWVFGDGTNTNLGKDSIILHKYTVAGKYTVTLIAENIGCFDTIKKIDTTEIFDTKANLIIKENPCIDDSVSIISTSNTSTSKYSTRWFLNNNLIYSNKDSFKILPPYGKYNMRLIVHDSATDCYDTVIFSFELRKKFEAGFFELFDSKILCTNVTVTFKDTSSKHKNSVWTIEDTIKKFDSTFKFTFTTSGLKKIKLVSTNDIGCKDSITKTFSSTAPTTTISVTPNVICDSGTINLAYNTSSSSTIVRKIWDIEGDTTIENAPSSFNYTFKKFPKNANKNLRLIFYSEDSNGCISLDTTYIKISNPRSNFTVSKTEMFCDTTFLQIKFDSTKSFTITKPYLSWFVNGIPTSETNSIRIFATKDTILYVNLIVKDSGYACGDAPSAIPISIKVKDIKTDFSYSDSVGNCPPLSVKYTNLSQAKNTVISKYQWFFGDGSGSVFQNPTKTYFYPGNYGVKLIVSDDEGCSDSTEKKGIIKINGPNANFMSSLKTGCNPVNVNFYLNSQGLSYFLWDLGNGVVSTEENPVTSYDFPGTFNPYLIARDSSGCTVTFYDDTLITVNETPVAIFSSEGICKNAPIQFHNLTKIENNVKVFYLWEFGDGDTSSLDSVQHNYINSGYYNVKLNAETEFGCKHDTSKQIFISSINANYSMSDDTICFGSNLNFTDLSTSDTTVVSWKYYFGNGDSSLNQNPSYQYFSDQTFTTSLTVTDLLGCKDSLTKINSVTVFDSATPKPINMLRTTVNSNSQVQFDWQTDTTPSVINYELYTWQNGIIDPSPVILYKPQISFLHNGLNTPSNNYAYYINSRSYCQSVPIFDTVKKHQTIVLNAFGSQNLITLKWNPYMGWNGIKNYKIYRKNQDSTTFILLDSLAGNTEYFDSSVKCNFRYTYYILAEENGGNLQVSYSNLSSANSLNPSIPNPPSIIRATVNSRTETQVDWDISKNNINPVKNYVLQRSTNGTNFITIIQTPDSTCCVPFLDNNVNTDNQSYTYRLIANDECEIKSEVSNIGKTILLDVNKNSDDIPTLSWSDYLFWDKGVKHYEIELKDNYSNFGNIQNFTSNPLIFTDSISDNSTLEQICYRIKAISFDSFTNGIPIYSYSNTRCVYGNTTLFVPNAFTPNSDENNARFVVYGSFIKSYHIDIYNRWGQLIFKSDSIYDSWDGTYQQNKVSDGIYIYQIQAQGFDGKKINLKGNITLLR